MLQRAAKNAHSWLWASHIRTKQSKWLDQNLQDTEEKVDHILKILEEDGDSFAQRAEMYYRKRPELINFVEDSFRGYRALAERYDHLSRELQTANRTIATMYPEQVQLSMDDEDENIISSSTHPNVNRKTLKKFPAAPKINFPENNAKQAKKGKSPSRVMSKKGLLKFNVTNSVTDTRSGMRKEEALEKINDFQKVILGFQTEKEFVQNLYENALAKFWEIEEKITEMQSKINNLQDEYGTGTYIEDDEARTLMAARALKTCREALVRLQDNQKRFDEETRLEYERTNHILEKIIILKGNYGDQTNKDAFHKKLELNPEVDGMEENEIQKLRERINKQTKENFSTSITMSEMAEKVNNLVEKVISLETKSSSQNALALRLRSETNDLQAQILSVEKEKEALTKGSDRNIEKLIDLEQEFLRIKNLNQNFNTENQNLQRCFTEASFIVDLLFEKLESLKPDEEVKNIDPAKELRNNHVTTQVKEFQLSEMLASSNTNSKILNMEYNASVSGKEKSDVPVTKAKKDMEVNEVLIASGQDSKNLDDAITYQNTNFTAEENNLVEFDSNSCINKFWVSTGEKIISNSITSIDFQTIDPNSCLADLFINAQAIPDPREHVIEQKKLESEIKDHYSPDIHEMAEQSFFSFNPFDCDEEFKEHEGKQAHANDITTLKYVNFGKGKIHENQDQEFNWSNPFDDFLLTETRTLEAEEADPHGLNKEHMSAMELKDSMFSKETMIEEKINADSIVCVVEDMKSFDQISLSKPVVSLPEEGKPSKEDEKILASGNDKRTLEHGKTIKEESKDENAKQTTEVKGQQQIGLDPSDCASIPQKVDKDQNALSKEVNEEEDRLDWKELFLNGLVDREKVLLQQYTATLRNYKKTKNQLNEMEKKNNDGISKSESQIKELKNANALKDEQIQSLHRKLNKFQVFLEENPGTSSTNSPDQQSIKDEPTFQVFPFSFPSVIQNPAHVLQDEQKVESLQRKWEGTEQTMISPERDEQDENCVLFVDQPKITVDDKFRSEIDGLLEENTELWLRFSTSLQQIQRFQTSVEDLRDELRKLGEIKKPDGGSKQQQPPNSEVLSIYKHLREIQAELTFWLEQNSLLEFDLRHRLTSLSRLQGEISSITNVENKEEENGMSDYQAAKFQEEILTMKQENNQVAQKFQLGLERVKELQSEIAKTISNLDEQLVVSATKNQKINKSSPSQSKVPLRSFLFGVKLKKQKPSLFHCMSPALQKQYSDLHSVQT